MITTKNYYKILIGIDRKGLAPELRSAADFVDEVTENGKDWSAYSEDDVIKRTIDEYFAQLSLVVGKPVKQPAKAKTQKPESVIIDTYKKQPNPPSNTPKKPSPQPRKPRVQKPKAPLRVVKRNGQRVERISEELKFLGRYVNLHNKAKTKQQVRTFLNSLQRAITEKRIRKTSPFAKEVVELQNDLIKLFESYKRDSFLTVKISDQKRNHLLNVLGRQELMNSVRFIKSYISLQGKRISNKQAALLHNRLAKAIEGKSITPKDVYWSEIEGILASLKAFVKKNQSEGVLHIPTKELHGLNGIVSGHSGGLNGISEFDTAPKNTIMSSEDFVKLKFNKLGFKGKWLDFIGNPSAGFMILVSAPAKYGKSIMCVDFAGYLARNHGTVLYVAKEEGLDDTLKEKLLRAKHPNLIVSDYLPEDLSEYDFVFLDSITRLHLSPEELVDLKASNPGVSFIAISQVTKAGSARGSNAFTHDVDSIVEFPQRGKAVQYGRFNQGGEMDVF
jgi:hypothetical protein